MHRRYGGYPGSKLEVSLPLCENGCCTCCAQYSSDDYTLLKSRALDGYAEPILKFQLFLLNPSASFPWRSQTLEFVAG